MGILTSLTLRMELLEVLIKSKSRGLFERFWLWVGWLERRLVKRVSDVWVRGDVDLVSFFLVGFFR